LGLAAVTALGCWLAAHPPGRRDAHRLFETARQARRSAETAFAATELGPAAELSRQTLESLDELLSYWPHARPYQRERALAHHVLGLIQIQLDEPNLAEVEFKGAVNDWATLLGDDQRNVDDRRRMGESLYRLGLLYRDLGRWDEAESTFRRGKSLCEGPPARAAHDRQVDQQWVDFLNELGLVLVNLGRPAQAVESCGDAVNAQKTVVKAHGERVDDRERLITLLMIQADRFAAWFERGHAEASLIEATELAERLAALEAGEPRHQDLVASTLVKRADLMTSDPKRLGEACGLLERARSIERALVDLAPVVDDFRARLAIICGRLAAMRDDLGSRDQAEALYREQLDHWTRLARAGTEPVRFQLGRGEALHNLADLLRKRGRFDEALPLAVHAVEQLGRVYREDVLDPQSQRALSCAFWNLCALELDQRDYRAAAEAVAGLRQVEHSGYDEALESARFLSRCASLCANDRSISDSERDRLTRAYQDQAVESMQRAVTEGYRDDLDLEASSTYAPLRGRDDFERLVRELVMRARFYGRDS
jgi:tetratricopeptide (TPR) repeat protein